MTPPADETVCLCKDCGRAAPRAGAACLSCGGELVVVPRPAAPVAEARGAPAYRHPQVLAAAVTFCFGLTLVRLLLSLLAPEHQRPFSSLWNDPLLMLMLLAAGTSLVYAVLRLEEGDFRALFLLTLALFLAAEVLVYLSSVFALGKAQDLGMVLSFGVTIYGLLALTAAFYDQALPSRDPYRPGLVAACLAMLAASSLRAMAPLLHVLDPLLLDWAGVACLGTAAAYSLVCLLRPPRSSNQNRQPK